MHTDPEKPQSHRLDLVEKNLVVLDRFFGILFLIAAGLAGIVGILALPSGGLFFAMPFLLFVFSAVFAGVGGLHLLASRGMRKKAAWRWIPQGLLLILLVILLLSVIQLVRSTH
jgi:hypothetical protein